MFTTFPNETTISAFNWIFKTFLMRIKREYEVSNFQSWCSNKCQTFCIDCIEHIDRGQTTESAMNIPIPAVANRMQTMSIDSMAHFYIFQAYIHSAVQFKIETHAAFPNPNLNGEYSTTKNDI